MFILVLFYSTIGDRFLIKNERVKTTVHSAVAAFSISLFFPFCGRPPKGFA
jgi:hypothetical protein